MPQSFFPPGTSEYHSRVGPSSLFRKGHGALTASERLRLGYTVGVEDTMYPLDGHYWLGEDPHWHPYPPAPHLHVF